MPSNSRSTSNPISDTFTGLVAMYVRLRVAGKQHLPKEGAWILVANHTSHADTAVLFAAVPRRLRRRLHAAAAQDYFFDRGLRQYAARTLFNAIPVDRQRSSGRDPLRHVLRALREGDGVLIFPEGTRSMDGRLGPFRGGIGRLIAEFPGVPVIPAYIEGTVDVLPKGHALPAPNVVRVTFDAPLRLPADPHDRA